jgi:hypothetical protein
MSRFRASSAMSSIVQLMKLTASICIGFVCDWKAG